ncbi:MAG: hypothetical protein LIO74_08945 [Ruminococcus sp.]|nr:hypothetical protein [Ruminococcus sp.]
MKKTLAFFAALTLINTIGATTAFAEDSVEVYVTIADENGSLVLAQEAVTVTDIDGDGALTINDALYTAHEEYYDGGAETGYLSVVSDYELSLDTLWGVTNGGSYGYYVNNNAAWSLEDTIIDGDYINAFIYTDLTSWSDTYCYFDVNTAEAEIGDTLTLTLSAYGYDADWNTVTLPIEDAIITIDGEETDIVTDENGTAILTLDTSGTHIISAVSASQILVPPVCTITVNSTEDTTTTTEETTTETTSTTEASTTVAISTATTKAASSSNNSSNSTNSSSSVSSSPNTGDTGIAICIGTGVVALCGLFLTKRKK